MRAALSACSLPRWSQFPAVLLMGRQHGNRGRALVAMALENSTHPRNLRNGNIDARDRDRAFVAGAEHFPGPLRFAAGDCDVDLRWLEHLDDFVGRRLQATGIGLDTGYRQRPQEGL